jgi:hypothetical protein
LKRIGKDEQQRDWSGNEVCSTETTRRDYESHYPGSEGTKKHLTASDAKNTFQCIYVLLIEMTALQRRYITI